MSQTMNAPRLLNAKLRHASVMPSNIFPNERRGLGFLRYHDTVIARPDFADVVQRQVDDRLREWEPRPQRCGFRPIRKRVNSGAARQLRFYHVAPDRCPEPRDPGRTDADPRCSARKHQPDDLVEKCLKGHHEANAVLAEWKARPTPCPS